ncbi:MAG: hypothetical protein H6713_27600 [Myxococcales bacterium]|nr:hypothetical protein [Myxococcales bacterium]MCB9753724.1 hypothetical protein [Myxococcales bacterium]
MHSDKPPRRPLLLALACALPGCATPVEQGCGEQLEGMSVAAAQELLEPTWTNFTSEYFSCRPYVIFWGDELEIEGTLYGAWPGCYCEWDEERDAVRGCELASTSEEGTAIYDARFSLMMFCEE